MPRFSDSHGLFVEIETETDDGQASSQVFIFQKVRALPFKPGSDFCNLLPVWYAGVCPLEKSNTCLRPVERGI